MKGLGLCIAIYARLKHELQRTEMVNKKDFRKIVAKRALTGLDPAATFGDASGLTGPQGSLSHLEPANPGPICWIAQDSTS